MIERLANLDRRFIFLLLVLCISYGLLFPKPLKISIDPPVKAAYDTISQLQPGDKVILSFDYGPSVMPELQPAALAILRHCFMKKADVILMTLWNEGLPMMSDAIASVAIPMGEKVNQDYVDLGFKWGGVTGSSVIEGLGSDIKSVFPNTNGGSPYDRVPLLKGVKNFKDIKLLISFTAGNPGVDEYIQYANARYHLPIVGVVTKVTAPKEFPFLNSGQLSGLVAGLVGGAEYEELIDHPGFGLAGLFALSTAQVTIILFILAANVLQFFAGRKKSK